MYLKSGTRYRIKVSNKVVQSHRFTTKSHILYNNFKNSCHKMHTPSATMQKFVNCITDVNTHVSPSMLQNEQPEIQSCVRLFIVILLNAITIRHYACIWMQDNITVSIRYKLVPWLSNAVLFNVIKEMCVLSFSFA